MPRAMGWLTWDKQAQHENQDGESRPPSYQLGHDEADPNELIPDRKLGGGYDDYYNGDIYDSPISRYEQEWETNPFVFPEEEK